MIANYLGLTPFEYADAESIEITDPWFGSNARKSRNFDCPSTLRDIPTDYSYLSFFALDKNVQRGNRIDLGSREKILFGRSVLTSTNDEETAEGARSYTGYYGASTAYIENSASNNGKTCLLVGDSFSHCLKRIIASNYKTTLVILPANDGREINRSLDSINDEYELMTS